MAGPNTSVNFTEKDLQEFYAQNPISELVRTMAIDRKLWEVGWRSFEDMCREYMTRTGESDQWKAFNAIANRMPPNWMNHMVAFNTAYNSLWEKLAASITTEAWNQIKESDPNTYEFLMYLLVGPKHLDPSYKPLFVLQAQQTVQIDWTKIQLKGLQGLGVDPVTLALIIGGLVVLALGIIGGTVAVVAITRAVTVETRTAAEAKKDYDAIRGTMAKDVHEAMKIEIANAEEVYKAEIKKVDERTDLTPAQKEEKRTALTKALSDEKARIEARFLAEIPKMLPKTWDEFKGKSAVAATAEAAGEAFKKAGEAVGKAAVGLGWLILAGIAAYLAVTILAAPAQAVSRRVTRGMEPA